MIYSERDFYSVSKPIFSYYCLRKKKERGRERWVVDGGGSVGLMPPLPNPATRRVSRREVSPRTPQVSDPSAGSAGRSSPQVWWPWNPRRGLLVLPSTHPSPNPPAPDLGTDGRTLRSSDARRCPGRWSPASTEVLGPASGWRARS